MARFHWLGAGLCGCALVLGGCVHSTKATFVQHYALATSPSASASSPPAAAHPNGKTLHVSRITVPEWLSGTAMYYRLDYRQDGRLSAYADSEWIAPPATLLEPLLQNTIASGGNWNAVTGPRNPAMADATLHLRLDAFSQAFAHPDQSTGVLDATATLIDNHDEHVIAQKHFHVEIAAPSPDAQGGVKALSEASRKFASDLQRWLRAAASTPRSQ